MIFANTLARKCKLPFLGRFGKSGMSSTLAPWTNASRRRGSARTSRSSPCGYGTGAGHDPLLESTAKKPFGTFAEVTILTSIEITTEHALADAVRFESSIEARSASVDWGF